MKSRPRAVRLSAAVAAALMYAGTGSGIAHARDLVWDWTPGDDVAQDGSGVWNTTDLTWVDTGTNLSTTWNNGIPDSATFGTGNATPGADPTAPYNVDLSEPITVQNIAFAEVAGDTVYSVSGFGGGSLTLNGNITKIQNNGQINFFLDTALSAGNHTVALADSPGDVVEFITNGVISGAGGLTLDNGAFEVWGTMALNQSNSYTGATNINKGRLVITTADSLGATSSGTTISNAGTLAIGGGGTTIGGDLNISEPITITRNTYTGGPVGEPQMFERYPAAIIVSNTGPAQTHTLTNLTVNSTDARISVNTNTLVIPNNVAQGLGVTTGMLSFTGDYAGFVQLNGDNSAVLGGIKLLNAVEVQVNSQANLGGASSPITFGEGGVGDATLGIMNGFMTDFGTHVVNYTSFSGGLDIPTGQTFNIPQNLTGGQQLNKRGGGTLNVGGTNVFSRPCFFDDGIVNFTGSTTTGGLRIRNATVRVPVGGSYITTGSEDSIIALSPGETGTLENLGGTMSFSNELWVGNDPGRTGTFNQTGGSTTINDWFVVGRFNAAGTVNLSGGTITKQGGGNTEFDVGGGASSTVTISNSAQYLAQTGDLRVGVGGGSNGTLLVKDSGSVVVSGGEFWVGQGGGSTGVATFQDSTSLAVNDNWIAIGRAGGNGTLNLTGSATLTRGGNNGRHNIIADGNGSVGVVNLSGNASMTFNSGEFWVGQGGGSNGTLNMQDNAAVSVNNNWVAIGRAGGTGAVNMSGGTFTKAGNGNFIIGAGGGTNGTLTQTGGTINNITGSETWIAEGATTGVWNFSGGTANLGRLDVGRNGGGTGTLNMSGTAAMNAGIVRFGEGNSVIGTVNLDGGTLQATQVVDGNSTGAATLNLNGGLLRAGATNTTDWMTGGITVNVKAGGAKLDSNGFNVTLNSPFLHDPALGATPDGGLTKSGAGTATLTGTNTYTGGTTVQAGTLEMNRLHENNAVTVSAGTLRVLESAPGIGTGTPSGNNAFVSRPSSLAIAAGATLDLTNNDLILDYTGPGDNPAAAIEALIAQGYNNGDWFGTGITSSTAQQDPAYALAVADNQLLTTQFASFDGKTVDGTTVLVKFTWVDDLDLDGLVTANDAIQFGNNYSLGDPATRMTGDMDYDGVFTANDAIIFGNNYDTSLPSLPEPGTLGVLGLAAAAGMLRRRRRSTACGV